MRQNERPESNAIQCSVSLDRELSLSDFLLVAHVDIVVTPPQAGNSLLLTSTTDLLSLAGIRMMMIA